MPVMIALLLWPLIEIAGFAWIGGAIGVGPTLAFVLASALIGLALMRREGLSTLARLQASLEAGDTGLPVALDGAWRILGGILLVVPGFFSSALAVLLLLPPVRAVLTRLAAKQFRPRAGSSWVFRYSARIEPERGPTVIEGDFHEVGPEHPELPPQR